MKPTIVILVTCLSPYPVSHPSDSTHSRHRDHQQMTLQQARAPPLALISQHQLNPAAALALTCYPSSSKTQVLPCES